MRAASTRAECNRRRRKGRAARHCDCSLSAAFVLTEWRSGGRVETSRSCVQGSLCPAAPLLACTVDWHKCAHHDTTGAHRARVARGRIDRWESERVSIMYLFSWKYLNSTNSALYHTRPVRGRNGKARSGSSYDKLLVSRTCQHSGDAHVTLSLHLHLHFSSTLHCICPHIIRPGAQGAWCETRRKRPAWRLC